MKTKATLSERLGHGHDSITDASTIVDAAFDVVKELEEEVEDELETYMTRIHELVKDPDITYSFERIEMELEGADARTRENISYYAGCISVLTHIAWMLSIDAEDYEQYATLLEGSKERC